MRQKTVSLFHEFFRMEASSGIVLLVCAVFAMAVANSPLARLGFSINSGVAFCERSAVVCIFLLRRHGDKAGVQVR